MTENMWEGNNPHKPTERVSLESLVDGLVSTVTYQVSMSTWDGIHSTHISQEGGMHLCWGEEKSQGVAGRRDRWIPRLANQWTQHLVTAPT